MKIYKIASDGPYYHASRIPLEIGTILTPEQGAYATNFQNEPSHAFLEQQKPPHMLSRFNAVFMFGKPYDVFHGGNVSSRAKHIYEVEALGKVETHHAEWVAILDSQMYRYLKGDPYENIPPYNPELKQHLEEIAQNYWNGTCWMNKNDGWEYLTPSAKIINEITANENEFDSLKQQFPHKY